VILNFSIQNFKYFGYYLRVLGWYNLKNWLRIIVLSEISEHKNVAELGFLSTHRGKFWELVGKQITGLQNFNFLNSVVRK